MNKSILNSAIAAAMAIGLAACSSGDSDVAGIGGSGVTPSAVKSSGTITGFGSIFVNGVEFETSSSTFSIDDNPSLVSESDLAIGMRVIVSGSINSDGITGTATSISFDDQLQGPISNVGPIDADGTGRLIAVLGKIVALDSTSTSFDISGTQPGVTFDFDNLADGNNVEVSGFPDSNGVIQATRIELKQATFVVDSSIVELKGTITGLTGTTFKLQGIAGITIDASAAAIDDLPGGLADGATVEVKGTCPDIACATIEATRVEGQSPDFGDNDDVEIEGIVTSFTDQNNFEVDGVPVDASGATRIPTTFSVALDSQVEVEGTIVNGTLIATKVKDEGDNIKVAATVTAVDSAAGSFELSPRAGQPSITVMIDTSTKIEDDVGTFNSAALLDNLTLGSDYLVVEGFLDGTTGTLIASEVKRETPDDVIVQGKLDEIVLDTSVTVLGVSFDIVDVPGGGGADETDFEDAADLEITQAEFIAAAPVGTLVKIKDKDNGGTNGVADEIEIELP